MIFLTKTSAPNLGRDERGLLLCRRELTTQTPCGGHPGQETQIKYVTVRAHHLSHWGMISSFSVWRYWGQMMGHKYLTCAGYPLHSSKSLKQVCAESWAPLGHSLTRPVNKASQGTRHSQRIVLDSAIPDELWSPADSQPQEPLSEGLHS